MKLGMDAAAASTVQISRSSIVGNSHQGVKVELRCLCSPGDFKVFSAGKSEIEVKSKMRKTLKGERWGRSGNQKQKGDDRSNVPMSVPDLVSESLFRSHSWSSAGRRRRGKETAGGKQERFLWHCEERSCLCEEREKASLR
jgi:hypothetical protein